MTASYRVAVVGGGPAGLSAARLLRDRGVRDVAVFEAEERVGGKSLSTPAGGCVHDMGTCYSTLAHTLTNRWMRQLGVAQKVIGRQRVDGRTFMKFVGEGPGAPLAVEGPKFIRARGRFSRAINAERPDQETLRAAAEPIEAWLERHGMRRMRRFMLRAITNMGYGFLDETPTVQALRWTTPELLLTGLLNQIKMPVSGWQRFWELLARDMDVRLGARVVGIERPAGGGAVVTTAMGAEHFDAVVITTPLDELGGVMALSDDERYVAEAINWGGYVSTLCEVEGWFRKYDTTTFSPTLERSAPPGALMAARRSGLEGRRACRSDHYLCGQYPSGLSRAALIKALGEGVAADGGRLKRVALQRTWKYFPRYDARAIEDGLLARMRAIQGVRDTWWSGASFSHEAVSNIVAHNVDITREIAIRAGAASRAARASPASAPMAEAALA